MFQFSKWFRKKSTAITTPHVKTYTEKMLPLELVLIKKSSSLTQQIKRKMSAHRHLTPLAI